MTDRSFTDGSFAEGIDACRPDSHDLQLSELAHVAQLVRTDDRAASLLERSGRLDRQLRGAIHNVNVPGGLADRIRQRLDMAANSALATAAEEPSLADQPRPAVPAPQPWKPLPMSIAIAASILVLLGAGVLYLLRSPEQPLTESNIAQRSIAWSDSLLAADLPESTPASEQLRWDETRFQRGVRIERGFDASELAGRPAAAYSLVANDGSRATLFVIDESMPVGQFPSSEPNYSTGGKAVAYWSSAETGLLQVVVVHDAADYAKFVNPALPRVALHNPQHQRSFPSLPSPAAA